MSWGLFARLAGVLLISSCGTTPPTRSEKRVEAERMMASTSSGTCVVNRERTKVACWGGGATDDGAVEVRGLPIVPDTIVMLPGELCVANAATSRCLGREGAPRYMHSTEHLDQSLDMVVGACFRRGDETFCRGNRAMKWPQMSGVTTIASAFGIGCARLQTRDVLCWSTIFDRASNDGEEQMAVRVGAADLVAVGLSPTVCVAQGRSVCVQLADHSVWCGSSVRFLEGRLNLRLRLEGVARLSFGQDHFCALRDGDEVVCWGRNGHRQLGGGSRNGNGPVSVSIDWGAQL